MAPPSRPKLALISSPVPGQVQSSQGRQPGSTRNASFQFSSDASADGLNRSLFANSAMLFAICPRRNRVDRYAPYIPHVCARSLTFRAETSLVADRSPIILGFS